MNRHRARIGTAVKVPSALFAGLVAFAAATVAQADESASSSLGPSRPFTVGATAGARSFSSDLDLETEMAFGLRLGLGASERVSVLLDALYSSPARKETGASAQVAALRGLAQVRLLLGSVRPYLLAGGGGILFDFDDSSDAAAGAVTAGGGFEFPIGTQFRLYAEGSADIYRARTVTYSSDGTELSATDRDTQTAVSALAGVSVEF